MARIRRFQKLGRARLKKQYPGVISQDSDNTENPLAAVIIPEMCLPERQWLRWRIFSDPDYDSIKPHEYESWRISQRIGDIERGLGDSTWDTYDEIRNMMEKYLPNSTAQNESTTVDADSVGINDYQSLRGKRSEIFARDYTVGLPRHAMLIGSSKIKFRLFRCSWEQS